MIFFVKLKYTTMKRRLKTTELYKENGNFCHSRVLHSCSHKNALFHPSIMFLDLPTKEKFIIPICQDPGVLT